MGMLDYFELVENGAGAVGICAKVERRRWWLLVWVYVQSSAQLSGGCDCGKKKKNERM
jgi:hypothetical protein